MRNLLDASFDIKNLIILVLFHHRATKRNRIYMTVGMSRYVLQPVAQRQINKIEIIALMRLTIALEPHSAV
jgi:hypothetical protein